ncbi:MAG: hypothetical protein CMD25_08960 [Flavobacteriales bacterium]|nr:hypothetical protein [Flavobacteriales bacterium]|tara:strand:+ start:193 stop:1419 length:1227 start_codon:yes stop_codon:yes gene_type:complete
MKYTLTIITIILFYISPLAQTVQISMGNNYANQVFYSMQNGEIKNISNDNWDLSFTTDQYASTIRTNDGKGVELYTYHLGDTSDWQNINVSIINNLSSGMYNSEISWYDGAFENNSLGHPDYGWGVYNMINHNVTGDSLYIIKTINGNWKKIWIQELTTAGEYIFKFANLDGSNEITQSILKTNYTDKNFIYFSIDQNTIIDREPISSEWDITFTKYISPVQAMPYPVTGVLTNSNTKVAKATGVTDPLTYFDYSNHNFNNDINSIGYDWKSYQGSYVVDANRCYFIKDINENIWRLVFNSFDGMSTGNIEFNTELIFNTSSVNINKTNSLNIFPNPTTQNTNLIFDFEKECLINIYDISGVKVYSKQLNSGGLKLINLPTENFDAGLYFLVVYKENRVLAKEKLIVQ